MANISITSIDVNAGDASSGGVTSADPAYVWVQLANDELDDVPGVNVAFAMSNGEAQSMSIDMPAGATEWLYWEAGVLAAGSYTCDISASGEVDQSSQLFGTEQARFDVEYVPESIPYVEISDLSILGRSAGGATGAPGEAYEGDEVTVAVTMTNVGDLDAPNSVIVVSVGDDYEQETHDLSVGGQATVTLVLTAEAVGEHEVNAWATIELNDSSQILAREQRTLRVHEASSADAPGPTRTVVDFSIAMELQGLDGDRTLVEAYDQISVNFIGPDGSHSPADLQNCQVAHGPMTCNDIEIPASGHIDVMATSNNGDVLTASGQYHVPDDRRMTVSAIQRVEQREVTASSSREVQETMEADVRAGIEISILEVGGGYKQGSSETEQWGESRTVTVYYPLADMALSGDGVTEN